MTFFSKVTGYLVDKYRGGSLDVAIHQSKEGGKPGTSMSGFAPGLEINPADGENIVVTKIKGSNSFVVSIGGVNQNIAPDTARGERRLYSVSADGKEIKAIAKFKNDGVLELNGATDSAVLFSELSSGISDLVSSVNTSNTNQDASINAELTKIATAINAIVPGSYTPTPIVSDTVSGDISSSESADVKIS